VSALVPRRQIAIEPSPLARNKLASLVRMMHHDATDPVVVRLASRIVHGFAADDWIAMAREIFRWVRDAIRYQHDPDRAEEFQDSAAIIERGYDDCDGKAKLAAAMMRAVGLDAEIVPHYRSGQLAHVSIRVRWPGSERTPGNLRGWIYGETTVRGAELGDNPRRIAPNPDTGRSPLSGGPRSAALGVLE
jgi:transglutaminase-like putative cysteine protease